MVSVTTFKHYLIEHKLHFVTCGPIRAKKKKRKKGKKTWCVLACGYLEMDKFVPH